MGRKKNVVLPEGTPQFVYSRGGGLKGTVIGTRLCQLEGCGCVALIVRWPDGHRTIPCSDGCTDHLDGVIIL